MTQGFAIDVLGGPEDEVCLVARGDLDVAAATAFRDAIDRVPRGGSRVVVDLRPLVFMDSTGLYALISAHQDLGERLVVLPGDAAERVLRITGMDSVLPLAPGV